MGELRCQYCTDAKCQWDTHVYACFILCHITLMIVHFFGCIHCFFDIEKSTLLAKVPCQRGQVSAGHTCLCPVVCPLKTASSCGTDKNSPLMQVIKTRLLLGQKKHRSFPCSFAATLAQVSYQRKFWGSLNITT